MAQEIKHKAIELGFDLAGVTDASPIDDRQAEFFAEWLSSGFAGRMDYMRRNLQKRLAPAGLLEGAQSVIAVGLNYTPPQHSSSLRVRRRRTRQSQPIDAAGPTGRVANYAQYQDYHPFIKERLRRLADFVSSVAGQDVRFKICVDTAPLAERAMAVRAGLGFIGKNHMLINPRLGCQIFLGEIITNVKLPPDEPALCHSERSKAPPHCHSERSEAPFFCHSERSEAKSRNLLTQTCVDCSRCIAACPTGALRADGQFDASRCINYLTIEYKGEIPPDLAEKIGDRLFGCDECVLACPYQKDAPACKNSQFELHQDWAELDLHEILDLAEESFAARFADSVIKRPGLECLKRNARICLRSIENNKARKLSRDK